MTAAVMQWQWFDSWERTWSWCARVTREQWATALWTRRFYNLHDPQWTASTAWLRRRPTLRPVLGSIIEEAGTTPQGGWWHTYRKRSTQFLTHCFTLPFRPYYARDSGVITEAVVNLTLVSCASDHGSMLAFIWIKLTCMIYVTKPVQKHTDKA